MANPRIPDNIHTLRGTLKPHRHGDPSTKMQVPQGVPEAPEFLQGEALVEWHRIIALIEGYVTEAERVVLTQYCILWARLAAAPDRFTTAQHTQLRACCQELGLTAASRSKINAPKKPQNAFTKFKGKR